MKLETLKPQFQTAFPRLASGKYVHFILLRHSQSFPIFQTDGILNTARTQAGINTPENISRLVLFKRKQTTPERLIGREILRSFNFTSSEENNSNYCQYNGEKSCKQCPDCIIYGFAIGDSGSERSKVYSDSAFSLGAYEQSHRSFTFNAPSEAGTMSEGGQMRSSINEQDHILPEITFPTVETLRDPTYESFIYVLGNLLRTRRYGAQETRTGTMSNYLLGIIFCDGEIFSNLYFTQALYDALKEKRDTPIADVCIEASNVARQLLDKEPVRQSQVIFDTQLEELLNEVTAIYQDEIQLQATLTTLYQQTQTYSQTFGALSGGKGKSKKK
ncbi:type I-D CRISPR-associated protein Cas7/Csc2 [Gloeothece verrucosa]|uniref:CRISPR-associated protein Csc2 n=1 Tax=Gloeothece verrucosa (strain PCC 7822) TaxID=497965 RepID=E0UKL8_GLOV7|nr:type I-D CRISPR-associated protein Cas7/Csc2 [Gloeothece verrucosa]ADN17498.1 CRISPR-associated protein Csc2 [Gloeothece verrucosa PCC 7822]